MACMSIVYVASQIEIAFTGKPYLICDSRVTRKEIYYSMASLHGHIWKADSGVR